MLNPKVQSHKETLAKLRLGSLLGSSLLSLSLMLNASGCSEHKDIQVPPVEIITEDTNEPVDINMQVEHPAYVYNSIIQIKTNDVLPAKYLANPKQIRMKIETPGEADKYVNTMYSTADLNQGIKIYVSPNYFTPPEAPAPGSQTTKNYVLKFYSNTKEIGSVNIQAIWQDTGENIFYPQQTFKLKDTIVINTGTDTTPPDNPFNFTVTAGATPYSAELKWQKIPETDFKRIEIYRDGTLIFSFDDSTLTNYLDNNIQKYQEYTYQILAEDWTGNKSELSTVKFTLTNPAIDPEKLKGIKCLGGSAEDFLYSVKQTRDGGFIASGSTSSPNLAAKNSFSGYRDVWVVKLDSNFNIQWQTYIGTEKLEESFSVIQTSDNGFIIGAYTGNQDIFNDCNYLVIKLDSAGNIQWQRIIQKSGDQRGYFIYQTADNNYIIDGTDGFYKLDNLGYTLWSKTGSHFIKETGSEYIVVDGTKMFGVNKTNGSVNWEKFFPTNINPYRGNIFKATNDGNFISAETEVNGNYVCLTKYNSNGQIIWQQYFGQYNSAGYNVFDIKETGSNGFILVGGTNLDNSHNVFEIWVMETDHFGNMKQQNFFGSNLTQQGYSIDLTSSGGYIIAGHIIMYPEQISNGYNGGITDGFILELDQYLNPIEH